MLAYKILSLKAHSKEAELLRHALASSGHNAELTCTDNVSSFLQELANETFDLIISDNSAYDSKNKKEQLYKEAINQSKLAVFTLNSDGTIHYANQFFLDILNEESNYVINNYLTQYFKGDQRKAINNFLQSSDESVTLECSINSTSLNDSNLWFKLQVKKLTIDNTPSSAIYIGSMVDITSHKKTELLQNNHILELRLLHEGTSKIAEAETIQDAYHNFIKLICEVINWPIGHIYFPNESSQLIEPANIWHTENIDKARKLINATNTTVLSIDSGLPGRIWQSHEPAWIADIYQDNNFPRASKNTDLDARSAVGFPILVDDKVIAVLEFFSYENQYKDENILRVFKLLGEQTGHVFERKRIEKKLETLAHFDVITGLPNRAYFQEMLRSVLKHADRLKRQIAVLFIDLDNFKQINDAYGHNTGDEILKDAAQRIKSIARKTDYIARLGGDEFTVILDTLESSEIAASIASRLIAELSKSYQVNHAELHLTCSIGISMYPNAGRTEQDLLKNADAAMYRAKANGKNNFQFYTDELNTKNKRRISIENNLHHAIKNNEFHLVYQPQFNLINKKLNGAEVLLRWNSSYLGSVTPTEFIPIAETSGLMNEIGNWVLEQAMQGLAKLCKIYPDLSLYMNVNCSILQFQKAEFLKKMSELTKKYNIKGEQIIVETTESVLMEHVQEVRQQLEQLNAMGIKIAIDDFGTGYSSLSYLKQLPISILKIDRSFVTDIPGNINDIAIVNAIIQLAASMGLEVVAEGVETAEQAQCLVELGCQFAQGFHLAKPMPFDQLVELLNNYTGSTAP